MKIKFNVNAFDWMGIARCGGCRNSATRIARVDITDIELLTEGQIKQQPNTEYFLHISSELPQLNIRLMIRENYDNSTCTYKDLEISSEDRDAMLCEVIRWLSRA